MRLRYPRSFQRLMHEVRTRGLSDQATVQDFRDLRLRKFIIHCAETVPYYQKKFRELGIRADSIKGLEDLSECLPIMDKDEAIENLSSLISETIPKREIVWVHTSGTTGSGFRFPTTKHSIMEQWAICWRYREWHGISMDMWCGYFGGRTIVPVGQDKPPFWRWNYAGKQILFSGYHLSEQNAKHYLDFLDKHKPSWLHGYPSLISLLASFKMAEDVKRVWNPTVITTGAESLLLHQREQIKAAFGVDPIQHYGQAEAVANISQCEIGNLHVDEDFGAVEFVPDKNGAMRIVGTNLSNPAFPLLRYCTGDTVTLKEGFCSCGKPGRLVENIDGRIEDYVVLKSGALVGRLDHIFKDLTMIKEAQIRQKEIGKIEVLVSRRKGYSDKDESTLLREIRSRLGDIEVELRYVERIDRTGAGKLRLVISALPYSAMGKNS